MMFSRMVSDMVAMVCFIILFSLSCSIVSNANMMDVRSRGPNHLMKVMVRLFSFFLSRVRVIGMMCIIVRLSMVYVRSGMLKLCMKMGIIVVLNRN